MSNIFRLTINALFELTNEQLVAVEDLSSVLRRGPDVLTGDEQRTLSARASVTLPQVAAAQAARKASVKKPPTIKRKAPTKGKPRPHAKPGTFVGKVWEAMQQSSGELTTADLAEILSGTRQQVSIALNALFNKHPTILKRTWVKGTYDTATDKRTPGYYKWQYTGKARAA